MGKLIPLTHPWHTASTQRSFFTQSKKKESCNYMQIGLQHIHVEPKTMVKVHLEIHAQG